MKLARVSEMRAIEARAITDYRIPGGVLMENAGRATFAAIEHWRGPLAGQVVAVVVGPGNNGGDGLVVARLLQQAACRVVVYALVPPSSWRGDAAEQWRLAQGLALPVVEVHGEQAADLCPPGFAEADFLVDAIFGTGLRRVVEGHYARVIAAMNRSGRPIVAVDIPSGLEADGGKPLGACVRAERTVTFAVAKPGHLLQPGREYVGRLTVADIGIPPEVIEQAGLTLGCWQAK